MSYTNYDKKKGNEKEKQKKQKKKLGDTPKFRLKHNQYHKKDLDNKNITLKKDH